MGTRTEHEGGSAEKLTDDIVARYDSDVHTTTYGYSDIEYSWTGDLDIYDKMFYEVLVTRGCSCGQSCYDRTFAIHPEAGYIQFLGCRLDIPDEVMGLIKGERSALLARLEKAFSYLKAGKKVDMGLLQKLSDKVNKSVEADIDRLKEGSEDRNNLAQKLQQIRSLYQSKEVQDIISDEKTRLNLQKMGARELLNKDTAEKKEARNKVRREVVENKKLMRAIQKRLTAHLTRQKKGENVDRKVLLVRLKKLRESFNSKEMKDTIPEESKRLKLRGIAREKMNKEAGM